MPKKPPINNPALQFFKDQKPKEAEPVTDQKGSPAADPVEKVQTSVPLDKPPKGYKINPELYVEIKSQRVQLVMQPSVVKRAKKAAAKNKISFNELASRAIIEYLEKGGF